MQRKRIYTEKRGNGGRTEKMKYFSLLSLRFSVSLCEAVPSVSSVPSDERLLLLTIGGRVDRLGGTRRRFSLARAIANREHRAVLGLAVALLLMAWKASYNNAF